MGLMGTETRRECDKASTVRYANSVFASPLWLQARKRRPQRVQSLLELDAPGSFHQDDIALLYRSRQEIARIERIPHKAQTRNIHAGFSRTVDELFSQALNANNQRSSGLRRFAAAGTMQF